MEDVMVSLAALWIPILLSAVVVFVVSSIIHTYARFTAGVFGCSGRNRLVLWMT
jgi:hypothetical protein